MEAIFEERTSSGAPEIVAGTGVDTAWFKDIIIYQLHVKAFRDSNGDGIGDFSGLIQSLDYLQELGIGAIWLLPFYPSPLKDDGYDIADYCSVNPAYGTIEDFKCFVDEAHRRGIRVITELVINHTSDQHLWFRRAREAPPGSPERDFYVWSDSDQRYQGTRVIFIDTETSNWAWDPVAKAYYWHRFYSHQPDLNFANPRVIDEVVRVLRYWLNLGVDGLRLDAVPYLCEREGTNNENLPETHQILKRIRTEVDASYPDRVLLAEANQWPEDTRPYFGQGDECQMAFHFPLMPRMYMALAQEDRHPITDILNQTPDIPASCQWALFLRNHDELTLEMVTDEERDYLWRAYATDPRARLNLGIRRRLAPLLDNDRRKIELMNALMLSMPGTPVIYYGDEIRMGDNYYLGDRDGVRTPMQWSIDRNGGFSRADPQRLYLPPIMDPIYGYQAANVEAMQKDPSSLLNWMRRLIAVRTSHKAFGRGSLTLLYPRNRKILAYLRKYKDERILCVANVSRSAQAVELDLSAFRGAIPVELTSQSVFPPIGELAYMLTLPAYGFFWFLLAREHELPSWYMPTPEPLPEFMTLIMSEHAGIALEGRDRRQLERGALPDFLPRQRWFAAKDAVIDSVRIHPLASLPGYGAEHQLTLIEVALRTGESQQYFLPLSVRWGEDQIRYGAPKLSYTVAKVRRRSRVGALTDGAYDEAFADALIGAMKAERSVKTREGEIRFSSTEALRALGDLGTPRLAGAEQSNVSLVCGDDVMLKIYRQPMRGIQPELEVGRFLTENGAFKNTPTYLGAVEHVPESGEPRALAAAFSFVTNQGDGWSVITEALARMISEQVIASRMAEAGQSFVFPLDLGATLGRRTAELHRAFASDSRDPSFAREPMTREDLALWVDRALNSAKHAFAALEAARSPHTDAVAAEIERLKERREGVVQTLDAIARIPATGAKTRIHGDYHLGQVLVAKTDVVIIDFEGEPQRPLTERREKASPLRDVAGMLRSFDYAARVAVDRVAAPGIDRDDAARALALSWRDQASRDFLSAYVEGMKGAPNYPDNEATAAGLLDLFLLHKAFYEIGYEAANRPNWLPIPVQGVLDLLDRREARA
jgi:maltose alpha-D-glucosyltransferase/alpha-amylase